jgi:hypothetical protein
MCGVAAAQYPETYTHQLTQSTADYRFWTTPPSERVFIDDTVPATTGSEIKVYAAQNEFEPFQVVVNPAVTGNVTLNMGDFGSGITTELYQVKHVDITTTSDNLGRLGPYPDPLWPLNNGDSVNVTLNENTAFWINVSVPAGTAPGDYTANVQIGGIDIPVTLHVFNFAIPDQLHVKSQMNFSHNTILSKYSVPGTDAEYWIYVDMIKQFFIDHRLTPKSVNWPGGVASSGAGPFIDYDCAGSITDNDGIWGFEQLADRYLNGTGLLSGQFTETFNGGTGFPSFMAATFLNNDASADQRRNPFCSLSRSAEDWYTANNPNSPYNQEWWEWMTALQNYLNGMGYLDKAYYYFANEPQDQADYDAVAWYSRHLKSAAPDFKLMISEEPKPEIYNHPDYVGDGQVDIWLPLLNNYDPEVSHDRELNHSEETWIYFLDNTRPPYFNPITLDHPGIESKFTGWFLWKYRIRGIAYYSLNSWSQNPWTDPMANNQNGDTFMIYPPSDTNTPIAYGSNNHRFVPSIRFELMRDSLEDFEYLYLLNAGGNLPAVGQANQADTQVDKIISGLTAYTRDSEFMYNLRRLIGLKIGDEIAAIPDIQPESNHPRAQGAPDNYYINFQNPAGEPTVDPLIVAGKEYMKIGWDEYDEALGYGWYGDMTDVMYRYITTSPNELQNSIIYDDSGRQKTFEFDLPNGTYDVTVSVGWQGSTYSHNQIVIEGVTFINDEASDPYLVRTNQVTVADNKLTMDMGIFNEYTILNYLDIEASPDVTPPVITIIGANPLSWNVGTTPYVDPGATAQDDVDGDLTAAINTDVSGVDIFTTGTYTVNYSVTDAAGNTATAQRTVSVIDPSNTPNGGGGGGVCFISSVF